VHLVWTPRARADFEEIIAHSAEDNPDGATVRVLSAVFQDIGFASSLLTGVWGSRKVATIPMAKLKPRWNLHRR
jgi:hypothetical protein